MEALFQLEVKNEIMKSLFYVDAIKPPSATALPKRFTTLVPTCRPTSRQDADDAGGVSMASV
ncbi:hypothetical protein [Janthinobacterium sp. BJB401]|uniref:hypothetical protein n=1 Tax=Janthinobacterium sp. BJB401 TaxID=2745934 RepID=UPI001595D4DD|nr:hypothetical protein [Janthinobacterium sp. BJB401]NVI83298.1 hypothetical protein [Janthinobacterium sp. BJB401]